MNNQKLFSFLLLILFVNILERSSAQPVAKIGYFLDNATHKHLLNPALVPKRGYLSYPLLSSIDFNVQSNLKLSTFLYPAANTADPLLTFMHPDVTSNQFLSQLLPQNYFEIKQRISLFSMGFYVGRSFWTFEAVTRINANLNLPYDLFAFMKNGMSSTQGSVYDINSLKVGLNALVEVSLGNSFKIGNNLRVGIKGKYLGGIAKLTAGIDEMNINMHPTNWQVSTTGLMNLYAPPGITFNTDADGYILTEGMPVNVNNSLLNQLAGQGFGLDVGFLWSPFKNLQISGGIIDVGMMQWNKNFHSQAASAGSVEFAGIQNIGVNNEDPLGNQFTNIQEGLMDMAKFKLNNEEVTLNESLVPTMNIGVEAGVFNNKLSVGLLYSNYMMPNNAQSELTAMLNLKPFSGFNIATSYTLINSKARTLGVALGLNLGIANIFVACDYIPLDVTPQVNIDGLPIPIVLPIHTLSTHLQIGVSLSLGKMKPKN